MTTLSDLEELLAGMSPEDKAELDKTIAQELNAAFLPNAGPQTDALLSLADITLYGGQAGGGKSALEIGAWFLDHYSGIIFRREAVQLDGLIQTVKEFGEPRFGTFVGGNENVFKRNDGGRLKFAGLNQADDWRKHAGNARDYMAFDEAGEFLKEQVFSLIGWLRSTRPGQRTRVILGSNPPRGGEGLWMIEEFAPWLDPAFPNPAQHGELRWTIVVGGVTEWVDGPGAYVRDGETYEAMSRTFIPASLDDNPYLPPSYRAKLQQLPEPLRSQLLHGDFLAGRQDNPYQVIPTEWVLLAQERWRKNADKPKGPMLHMGVDVAQGGLDATTIATLYGARVESIVREKGKDTPDGPSVALMVLAHRRNECGITIDLTGGWGGSVRDHLKTHHEIEAHAFVASSGSQARTKDGKLEFLNLRAESWWRLREELDPSGETTIELPPDPRLQAQLTAPTWSLRGNRIIVESKDDIRKRLGSSTDEADAVIMCWLNRGHTLVKRHLKAVRKSPQKADPLAAYRTRRN